MIGPVKKRSKAKKKQRHAAWQFDKIRYRKNKLQTRWSDEGQCRKLNHRVCPKSWVYKGRQVMTIKTWKASERIIDA